MMMISIMMILSYSFLLAQMVYNIGKEFVPNSMSLPWYVSLKAPSLLTTCIMTSLLDLDPEPLYKFVVVTGKQMLSCAIYLLALITLHQRQYLRLGCGPNSAKTIHFTFYGMVGP